MKFNDETFRMEFLKQGRIKNINNYEDILQLLNDWISYLETTPWSNADNIFENFDENAISFPIYSTQYEVLNTDPVKITNVQIWQHDVRQPNIEHFKTTCNILNINYEQLYEYILTKSNEFHQQYWTPRNNSSDKMEPIDPVYQRLMNDTLLQCYQEELETKNRNTLALDYTIAISIRIDNLFSNKEIEINFENYVNATENYVLQLGHLGFHQLDITHDVTGVMDITGASNDRLMLLQSRARERLYKRYEAQMDTPRRQIKYVEQEEDKDSERWLTDKEYPTNSRKIII